MITRPAADATKHVTAAAGNFLRKFHKWHQKRLIGVSLKVVAPTGQYNETKLINWDANGWAFRPEARILRALGQGRAGRLRRREVLYAQSQLLRSQQFRARVAGSVADTRWHFRRSPELRLEAENLGIAGRWIRQACLH